MANSDVPISAHNTQENRAGELVDTRGNHVRLAGGIAEDPLLVDHRDEEEGDADEEAFVGDGEIDDVHIRDGLHLRVADHHVDD